MVQPHALRKIQVLIVDDHPLVREGLRALIARHEHLQICGEAEDEGTGMRLVRELKPDVVIVDISLKQGSGIELIKQVRAQNQKIRMIVSSMHDDNLFAERALHAGAMGYLNKQESSSRLVEAIHCVMDGRVFVSKEVSNRLLARMTGNESDPTQSPLEGLTDRELEVFELIGHGASIREIARRLHLSPKTIERYRENIKRKLKVDTASDLVRHATRWMLENS